MVLLANQERVCLRGAAHWSDFLSVMEDEEADLSAAPVSAAAARRLQDFYAQHEAAPMPELPELPTTRVDLATWYGAFISSLAHDELQDLLVAADFLGFKEVIQLGCCYIAGLPRGHRFLKK